MAFRSWLFRGGNPAASLKRRHPRGSVRVGLVLFRGGNPAASLKHAAGRKVN